MARWGVGQIIGHDKNLAVLGGDNELPRVWQTNSENDIPDKLQDLLDNVASYDGSGTWFMSKGQDGFALVLIHEKGRRVYVVGTEFWVGDGPKAVV